MPQLDHVTYFSQFFWLCFFFFGFYLLCLKYFLPALSRLMKYRRSVTQNADGPSSVLPAYEDLGLEALKTGRQSLSALDAHLNEWSHLSVKQANANAKFKPLNLKVIDTLTSESYQNHVVLGTARLLFPPTSLPLKGVRQKLYARSVVSYLKNLKNHSRRARGA